MIKHVLVPYAKYKTLLEGSPPTPTHNVTHVENSVQAEEAEEPIVQDEKTVEHTPNLDALLDTVNPRTRSRYKSLLLHLRGHWNDKGEILDSNSVPIHHTHILDLARYVITPSCKTRPKHTGLQRFYELLRSSNIPQYLIANRIARADIEGQHAEDEESTPLTTSDHNIKRWISLS